MENTDFERFKQKFAEEIQEATKEAQWGADTWEDVALNDEAASILDSKVTFELMEELLFEDESLLGQIVSWGADDTSVRDSLYLRLESHFKKTYPDLVKPTQKSSHASWKKDFWNPADDSDPLRQYTRAFGATGRGKTYTHPEEFFHSWPPVSTQKKSLLRKIIDFFKGKRSPSGLVT